jgi:Uma2 family endonuclease
MVNVTSMGMPMDEFIRLYDREGPFELIDGERIPVMPQVAGHAIATQNIWVAVYQYAETREMGDACMRTPYVETNQQGQVIHSRTPDVMYFRAERLIAYIASDPDWKLKPYMLVPDIAIEVVAPDEDLDELDKKANFYLSNGVRLVWVINPWRNEVATYTPDGQKTLLSDGNTLTGGDVIPGFEMPVAKIFE